MSLSRDRRLPALFCVFALASCQTHTSDESLSELFNARRPSFFALKELLTENPEIKFISPNYILTNTKKISLNNNSLGYKEVMTQQKWDQYQSFFAELRLRGGVQVAANGSIYFVVDHVSIFNGDSEKGIVYTNVTMNQHSHDLNTYKLSTDHEERTIYKKLMQNWYMYLLIN